MTTTSVSQRQRGELDVALERDGATTRAARLATRPPIQLSRLRYDQPDAPGMAALTMVHLGGILAGDRYDLRVTLGQGAEAAITTAAATQVYRMPALHAEQSLELRLDAGARLRWLPEPTILFGGADFRQETRVLLGAGARLALLDVLVPGRLARGERFAFRRYASRVEICDAGGRLLAAERFALEPGRQPLDVAGVLAAQPVAGSLYLLGDTVDAAAGVAALARRPGLGATALPGGAGLLVRAVGHTGSAVRAALLAAMADLAWV